MRSVKNSNFKFSNDIRMSCFSNSRAFLGFTGEGKVVSFAQFACSTRIIHLLRFYTSSVKYWSWARSLKLIWASQICQSSASADPDSNNGLRMQFDDRGQWISESGPEPESLSTLGFPRFWVCLFFRLLRARKFEWRPVYIKLDSRELHLFIRVAET